jgi:glycosyltransferase involved in cell wall biosynthesis
MLRGAWLAGWVASGLERTDARHVHAHFAHDPACVGLAAAGLARLPFTFTVHAHDIYLRNRGLALRTRKADKVVTVCEYNVEQLLQRCAGLERAHIEVVYCGVDPDAFLVHAPRPARAVPRVLSVGRLVEQKGFHDLIRAAAILRADGVEIDCEIVGRGPLRTELEALVDELELRGVVRFSGALLPDEVGARLADCDLFVLACRIDESGNRDSMPVVIKEAMASAVPVVSTDTVGVPEMVDDEVGRLARPDDPGSLARAMADVLALTEAERRVLGLTGRARVEERFNLHTETAKLRDLIGRLGR